MQINSCGIQLVAAIIKRSKCEFFLASRKKQHWDPKMKLKLNNINQIELDSIFFIEKNCNKSDEKEVLGKQISEQNFVIALRKSQAHTASLTNDETSGEKNDCHSLIMDKRRGRERERERERGGGNRRASVANTGNHQLRGKSGGKICFK